MMLSLSAMPDARGREALLAAFEVPPADAADFHAFLDRAGYAWMEETGNAAFALFLRAP